MIKILVHLRLLDIVFDLIVLILFSFIADFRHVLSGLFPVWAKRCFTRQYKAIDAIRYLSTATFG